MSKVSSKLVAGVSKVKEKQAAASATRKPASPDVKDRRPVEGRSAQPVNTTLPEGRGADVPPTPVWPD
jgi:hypothetical protein